MLPFTVRLKPGLPAYEQILYAVKKSVVTGQLRPGDDFPSVRTISQELRINPNTAHKVVAVLEADGLLEVRPGVGTVVARIAPATREQRRQLLNGDLERLVVDAKTLRLEIEEVFDAVRSHWTRLTKGKG